MSLVMWGFKYQTNTSNSQEYASYSISYNWLSIVLKYWAKMLCKCITDYWLVITNHSYI